MSSTTLVLRLPERADVTDTRRATAEREAASRHERPARRGTLAQVAEDVSPSLLGGFRHFVW